MPANSNFWKSILVLLPLAACSPGTDLDRAPLADRPDPAPPGPAVADSEDGGPGSALSRDGAVAQGADIDGAINADAGADAEALADAEEQVDEAVLVVNQMNADPEIAQLLSDARGVFIVPDYAQAGAVIGGEGGEGVVLLRSDSQPGSAWSPPAFFNIGGVTVGAELGVEAGSIALLLMTDQAAQIFRNGDSNFSLDASAGLTIVDFSARVEAGTNGDIVAWSDTEGAFAGATIGVRNINRDEDEIAAYYGPGACSQEILSGNRTSERARRLQEALPG
jgi:lipid-binding SYLF domain-containing protein